MGKAHTIDNALNIDLLPDGFIAALEKAWGRDTCWPGCIEGYPENREENPSFGNCLVTVLAAWAERYFQDFVTPGKIDETAWHFRLAVRGHEKNLREEFRHETDHTDFIPVDPTWQQCEAGAVFRELEAEDISARPEYKEVIQGSFWEDDSLEERLQLLLDRMRDLGDYRIKPDAAEIINKVQRKFDFIFDSSFLTDPDFFRRRAAHSSAKLDI